MMTRDSEQACTTPWPVNNVTGMNSPVCSSQQPEHFEAQCVTQNRWFMDLFKYSLLLTYVTNATCHT